MCNKIIKFCAVLGLISSLSDGAFATQESTDIDNRIIGGNDTTIDKWPFIVQILFEMDIQFCAGSLLTTRVGLSAAHCFDQGFEELPDLPEDFFHIRAGSTTVGEGGIVTPVIKAILHEDFNRVIYRDCDIALFLIKDALPLGNTINVARLPVYGSVVPDDAVVTYVGWGLTSADDDADQATILQEVDVYNVNIEVCREGYREIEKQVLEESGRKAEFTVTDNMICAGVMGVGGKDACTADSGGPLLYNETLVGVISWGFRCADPIAMGVSVRVANFNVWIDEAIKQLNATEAEIEIEEDKGQVENVEEDKNQTNAQSTARLSCILAVVALFCTFI
ncbi:hypothetical protein O0L34_g1757 [Tuta absoluta]|nr:hypothetical protein O0L34_g1757 [Tuta absoluta]